MRNHHRGPGLCAPVLLAAACACGSMDLETQTTGEHPTGEQPSVASRGTGRDSDAGASVPDDPGAPDFRLSGALAAWRVDADGPAQLALAHGSHGWWLQVTGHTADGAQEIMLWLDLGGGVEQPQLAPGSPEVVVTFEAPRASGRLYAHVYGCARPVGASSWSYDATADQIHILSLPNPPPGTRQLRVEAHFADQAQPLVAELKLPLAWFPPWPWVSQALAVSQVALNGLQVGADKAHVMGDVTYTELVWQLTGDATTLRVVLPRGVDALGEDPAESMRWSMPPQVTWGARNQPATVRGASVERDPAGGGWLHVDAVWEDGTMVDVVALLTADVLNAGDPFAAP